MTKLICRFLLIAVFLAGCTSVPSTWSLSDSGDGSSLGGLAPSGTVTQQAAQVLGLDGKPAAGVLVRAHLISNNTGSIISNNSGSYRVLADDPTARTDEQGRFTLALPAGQPYNIEAVLSDTVKAIKLGVQGSTDGLRLRLAYTGHITGRVSSSIPSLTNFLGTEVFIPGTSYLAKADQAGNFTISNVAVGTFSLVAMKSASGRANLNGVTVASDQTTNVGTIQLQVTAPSIASLSPINGGPGTVVTVTGADFGASSGTPFQVTVGGAVATNPQRTDDHTITFTVPSSATSGDTVVTVDDIPSNASPFAVIKTIVIQQSGRNLTLLKGSTRTFTALAYDTVGTLTEEHQILNPVFQWSTSGPAATVDTQGTVTASSVGYATLTATSGTVASSVPLNLIQAYPVAGVFAGRYEGYQDGTGTDAMFDDPGGLCMAPNGDVFVADATNQRIRRVTPEGVVTTYAGTGDMGRQDGPRLSASFKNPTKMTVDGAGNLYVSEISNHDIRKITPAGEVSTLAGSGTSGFQNGQGQAAQFAWPSGLAVDGQGNVYVADSGNHWIRKVTPAGAVTTFAGTGERGFADGAGASAQFDSPEGLAMDAAGNLYVADYGNHRIRKITPSGVVSTFSGTGERAVADGPANRAKFDDPYALAIDAAGNLYVTDQAKDVRKVTPDGTVFTVAGPSAYGRSSSDFLDGGFGSPTSLAIAPNGTVYLIEYWGDRLWKLTPERDP